MRLLFLLCFVTAMVPVLGQLEYFQVLREDDIFDVISRAQMQLRQPISWFDKYHALRVVNYFQTHHSFCSCDYTLAEGSSIADLYYYVRVSNQCGCEVTQDTSTIQSTININANVPIYFRFF